MNFGCHLGISTAISLGIPIIAREIGVPIDQAKEIYIIPAIILGGIFSDIDTESIPSKIYAGFAFIALIILAIKNKPWHGVMLMAPYLAAKISKHRGWTHSIYTVFALLISPLIIATIAYLLPFNVQTISDIINNYYWLIVSFSFGICIHKFLDIKWFKLKRKLIRKRK